jgi:drug/metabolite transporter (DMT)-like permease
VRKGIAYALASAVLFGLSTPVAKALVGAVPPLMLAGLLYAGSGIGLLLAMVVRGLASDRSRVPLPNRTEWLWLGAAIVLGGILGPVALMYGLSAMPASTASLLLNLEGVFTALIAWFLFRENFDRRVALGMLAIVAGGFVLAWSPGQPWQVSSGALFIVTACLCWALDNNLTRRASTADAVTIAAMKGVVAGAVNLGLAWALGQRWTGGALVAGATVVGLFGYGISLVLFVLALRDLGSARATAYFSIAPFFGTAFAVVLQGDPVTAQLIVAGVLMGAGLWLHLAERHEHLHAHEALEHAHSHRHDDHHRHAHDFEWDGREPHFHAHAHRRILHAHPHYPDVHHRHRH